tara:strand:- start:1194 stop:4121 length:2928 start_codon:yes stop_codon:yes gene_type:complete
MQNFKKILSIIALAGATLSFNAHAIPPYLQAGSSSVPGFIDGIKGSPQYQNYMANGGSQSFNASVGGQRIDQLDYIWCQNSSGVFRHKVGERRSDGSGPEINNCNEYGGGVTELSAAQMSCLSQGNTYSMTTAEFDSNPCKTGRAIASEDDDNIEDPNPGITDNGNPQAKYCRKLDNSFEVFPADQSAPANCTEVTDANLIACFNGSIQSGSSSYQSDCQEQITAAYQPTNPDPNPNPTNPGLDASNPELDHIACNGTLSQTPIAATGSRSDLFNFQSFAADINAGNETLAEQGNEADGYFFKSDLLVACENLGTEPWAEFRSRITTNDAWKPSWQYLMKDMIGLQSDSGISSPGVLEGITFDEKEQAFLKRCVDGTNYSFPEPSATSTPPKLVALRNKVKQVAMKGIGMMDEHRKLTEKCEALVYLTGHSDFGAEYPMTPGSTKTTKKSFDGKITCEAYGAETQDYKACKTFVNTYDASMVAKTALNAGQGIHYQGQTMDRQAEMTRQGQTGGIDHRGALGAQKDDIKDRAGYATQTAVLDSAKLAALFGQLQAMPTRGKLKSECAASFTPNERTAIARVSTPHVATFEKFIKVIGLTEKHLSGSCIPGDTGCDQATQTNETIHNKPTTDSFASNRSPAQICDAVVSSARGSARDEATSSRARARTASSRSRRRGGSERTQEASMSGAASLIMNDAMRSVAKQILAQTAVEAAASFMKAGMLNKQAKTIDELLKKIEGYDPSGDFVPPNTDLLAGPCAFDPSAEGCGAGVPLAARQVGFGSNSLSFGNGGFGSSGTNLDADTGFDNAAGDGTGSSDRSGASGPVGSLITGIDKPSGFEGGVPGAASIKSSAAGRSGGGGGGASAIGSTGGSAGGGSGSGAKGGAASAGKKLDYAGSSIGRLSGGRGVGRKPASKDAGANPFANMFKKGGPQNGTLNFRNPAGIGNKTGNIFDQISERYQVVQGKNLLLEYEEKK